jgi:hypothetical protein
MIDLNKQIRHKTSVSGTAAEILKTHQDGTLIIEWISGWSGRLQVGAFPAHTVEHNFENIPPGPRRVTVWPVWYRGNDVSVYHEEEAAIRLASENNGRVGKPIEIVEEYL